MMLRLAFAVTTSIQPDILIMDAAESHVDRSIRDPESFIQTNIVGTFRLLSASHAYWADLPERAEIRISLFACFDGRSLRLAHRGGRAIQREHAVRAQQPLCGK